MALNAGCVSCHSEEAEQWSGSYHQRSDIDPAYRAAFAIEPTAFCRGCHAPEANPAEDPPRAVSELGVGCVTCHVTREGSVLAAALRNPAEDGAVTAPHPLHRSTEFAQTGGCAGCHEFPFPMPPSSDDDHFMQTTVREHERSPAASTACAACHMPLVEGRRSHAFAEVRDPAWLKRNLRVTAERMKDSGVRITLVQPAPGHAFPSGDLFRRLEIGGELRRADGQVIRREVQYLARHFEAVPGAPGRPLVRDDRVFAEPSIVELDLSSSASPPPPRGALLAWWVSCQRVATVGSGRSPAEAKVESEIRLHSGVLPWNEN